MENQIGIKYTEPSESFWDVPGVVYKGEIGIYRIFNKMNPLMNHGDLAEFSEKEKQKGNPHTMDSILHFAIPLAAYNLKDVSPKEAESLRGFLQKGFRQWPNTLTRVIYNPLGEDEVIHNYGTTDKYSLNGKVVGSDSWIKDMKDKRTLELFLGTSDVSEINNVFSWINKTPGYILRVNKKPKEKDEGVVRLGASGDGVGLDCDWSPSVRGPSFRVLRID